MCKIVDMQMCNYTLLMYYNINLFCSTSDAAADLDSTNILIGQVSTKAVEQQTEVVVVLAVFRPVLVPPLKLWKSPYTRKGATMINRPTSDSIS